VARDFPDSPIGRAAAANGKASGHDVLDAAEAGDPHAVALFERLGTFLGVGISNAINIFEPEYVVVGGGLSRAAGLFFERAVEEARERALPVLSERVRISLARAGVHAGVVGAGLLALHELDSGRDTAQAMPTKGLG
jgi:glucokinase